MRRVYLDQNKWIDLARADRGHPLGASFAATLGAAHAAVAAATASFPLSSLHYLETWNSKNPRWRSELAATMLKLARPAGAIRPHTIAHPLHVAPMQFDRALQRRFGRPVERRVYPVFGEGYGHAFGRPHAGHVDTPDELVELLGVDFCRALHDAWAANAEAAFLELPPADVQRFGLTPGTHQAVSQAFATQEADLVTVFQQQSATRIRRSHHLAAAALREHLPAFAGALLHAGLADDDVDVSNAESLLALVRDVPSCHIFYELQLLRHDNPQYPREKGDLADLAFLSVALRYCDVVVTEVRWAHLIRRARLDEQYETTVLSDLAQLAAVL